MNKGRLPVSARVYTYTEFNNDTDGRPAALPQRRARPRGPVPVTAFGRDVRPPFPPLEGSGASGPTRTQPAPATPCRSELPD
jgi:hypothetical protein